MTEIDWAGHFIPDVDTTYVANDPENFHYYFWPGGSVIHLYANTAKAPFSDLEFRRAMSAAIDYESVVGIGMYGYTIVANPVGLSPARRSRSNAVARAIPGSRSAAPSAPQRSARFTEPASAAWVVTLVGRASRHRGLPHGARHWRVNSLESSSGPAPSAPPDGSSVRAVNR